MTTTKSKLYYLSVLVDEVDRTVTELGELSGDELQKLLDLIDKLNEISVR